MRISQASSQENFSFKSDNEFDASFPTSTAKRADKPNSNRDGFLPGFIDLPPENTAQELPSQSEGEAQEILDANKNLGVSALQNIPAKDTETEPAVDASQGNTNSASQLVDTQGSPLKTSDSQTAQTSVAVQPLPTKETPLVLSDINPLYWLLLLPAILIPLLLFRFVMGTSSSNDLERYNLRGPKVEDPEAPNVRGRFKKRPRTDLPAAETTESGDGVPVVDTTVNADTSTSSDDELDFLDEIENDVETDVVTPEYNEIETPQLSDELSTNLTSEPLEPDDFATHPIDNQTELASTNLGGSTFSSESEPLNNQSDSDLDFDFFSDDDDVQANDSVNLNGLEASIEPAEAIEENLDDALAGEELVSAEAVANNSLGDLDESVAVDSASDDSDEDFNFFDDDDEDGFSLEDDDAETPAIAVSDAETTAEAEVSDANVFAMDEEAEESEDHAIGTAAVVATAAGAAAVTAASTKGGSWMKRLFGGKKKNPSTEELPEDDAIAATAIKEDEVLDIADVDSSEGEQFVVDDLVPKETTLGDAKLDQSGEIDFSDSSDAFSLAGDDSSDGMFEDDSDLDYHFDAEEVTKPEALETDSIAISEDDDDSIEDFESLMDEQDDEPINISVDADEADDSFESISLAEDDAEPADFTASLEGVESIDCAEEFTPIGHPSSSEELPLLEDQMLDDIVDSESHSAEPTVAAGVGIGAALAGSAGLAAVVAGRSTDSNDALLDQLQSRIDELESKNSAMESDRSSLKSELEELREASENNHATAEEQQQLEELEKQLAVEREAKQELEKQLAAESESKKLATEEAEQARLDLESAKAESEKAAEEAELARSETETAKAEIETAKAEAETANANAETAKVDAEKATAEANEYRQKAEEALASVQELEQAAESQSSSTGMLGGSLLAAAGGAVAGTAMSGNSGKSSSDDDPYRLEPEQVKVMLKKLKNEKKKRAKTKEYFIKVDAKRREVTQTLEKVTGELDNLKREFQKVTDGSADGVSKENVKGLMAKLASAEDALKKNR